MSKLAELEQSVIEWAADKGIFTKATAYNQAQKTLEECGELLHAIGQDNRPEIIDSVGDIAVTIIIQAHMQGLDLETCLQSAYDVIKHRKGSMKNGQFVKE